MTCDDGARLSLCAKDDGADAVALKDYGHIRSPGDTKSVRPGVSKVVLLLKRFNEIEYEVRQGSCQGQQVIVSRAGEPARRPRLEDVAAEVGVSPATVSMVLRGVPGPSAATRERVTHTWIAPVQAMNGKPRRTKALRGPLGDRQKRGGERAAMPHIRPPNDHPTERRCADHYEQSHSLDTARRGRLYSGLRLGSSNGIRLLLEREHSRSVSHRARVTVAATCGRPVQCHGSRPRALT